MRSYVRDLRDLYQLSKEEHPRTYSATDELPMGQQAQVDWGEITVKNHQHTKDRSKGIQVDKETLIRQFQDQDHATQFIRELGLRYPRYIREQLHVMQHALTHSGVGKTHIAIGLGLEAIQFDDDSYRLKHRLTIFERDSVQS